MKARFLRYRSVWLILFLSIALFGGGIQGAIAQIPISCGQVVNGKITTAGQIDSYTFSSEVGDRISLTLAQTIVAGGGFNVQIDLLAPSGAVVIQSMPAGRLRDITLPEGGDYLLRVHDDDYSQTGGSYALDLHWVLPVSKRCPNATLSCGQITTGSLTNISQVDVYVFSGAVDDRVSISLAQTTVAGGGFDVQIDLLAPSGAVVIQSMPAGQLRDITLPEGGDYLLRVHEDNYSRTGGSYALDLHWVLPVSKRCPNATLSCGQITTGSLTNISQVDVYVFSGAVDDRVSISLAQTTVAGGGFDVQIDLLAPSGAVVIQSMPAGQLRDITLPEGGDYLLRVHEDNYSRTGGSYALDLHWVLPVSKRCPNATLSCGQITTGSLTNISQVNGYVLAGAAGDQISLTLAQTGGSGSGFTVRADLLAPSGTVVIQGMSAGQLWNISLLENGDYLLRVHDSIYTRTGSYTLDLHCLRQYGIALVQGFNLFAYPAPVPAENDTCRELLANLGTPAEVQSIARLNPTLQRFETCNQQGGQDFPITLGEGYVVRMATAKTVTVSGQPTCPSVVTLAPGVNLIGHPQPPADLHCFGLLTGMRTSAVKAIQRFNTITGAFETCIWVDNGNGPQPAGVDFPIVSGEGYVVHTLTGGPVTLPGCGH